MKKYTILLLLVFGMISCGKDNEKSMIKETGEIVDGYIETLETAPGKAREVKDLIESNQNKMIDDINKSR